MLTNAKVGDILLATNRLYGNDLLTVTRVTKTQVICDKLRFTRRGRRVGESSFHKTWAHIVTDAELEELKDEYTRRRCINGILAQCSRDNLIRMTTNDLRRIQTLLGEANDT